MQAARSPNLAPAPWASVGLLFKPRSGPFWICSIPFLLLPAVRESVSQCVSCYTPPSMEDTGPHAHTRCTRLAREPTRGTLSPAVALGPDCWTHNTQLTGQLTRWRCIVGFSGTDTGEEGGAQGRGHRTHELISHPAPGAVARASAGVFGPAVWQAPGHRSAGRAFKPHPRSAPALRRDPARC